MSKLEEIESLSAALAELQDEKRQSRRDEGKAREELERIRERYGRESLQLNCATEEASRAAEEVRAALKGTDAVMGRMKAVADERDALTAELEETEAALEAFRAQQTRESHDRTDSLKTLLEELRRKRGSVDENQVTEKLNRIKDDLAGSNCEVMAAELEKFAAAEPPRTEAGLTAQEVSRVDVMMESADEALKREKRLLDDLTAKATAGIKVLKGKKLELEKVLDKMSVKNS